jgi:hypothetical protein
MYGLEKSNVCLPRQNRWLFEIPGVAADDTPGVDALPPQRGSRPNIGFKEMEAKHLIEDMFYPAKPDWKPIQITLYDVVKTKHPVWEWLKKLYKPNEGKFLAPVMSSNAQPKDKFIKVCYLKMLNGCGGVIETWVFEDAWPNNINFQTLDMGSSAFLTCDITLRYARAYIQTGSVSEQPTPSQQPSLSTPASANIQ